MTSTLEKLDNQHYRGREINPRTGAIFITAAMVCPTLFTWLEGGTTYLVAWAVSETLMAFMAIVLAAATILDYLIWKDNVRDAQIARRLVSTYGWESMLLAENIENEWTALLDDLDYAARRPRWNPFRYK
jgi:hypothetical protein